MLALVAVALACVIGSPSVQAGQSPQKPPDPIKWSITAAPGARPTAGRVFSVIVTATIDPGWHLYSMSQPAGGPIAMSVTLPNGQAFSLAGKVDEPQPVRRVDKNFPQLGESLTFDDKAEFTVPVRVAAGTPAGAKKLQIDVEFQVCSDRLCLAAQTVALKLDLMVEAAR
jgi:thiol:disulfide interchange protein DsbD